MFLFLFFCFFFCFFCFFCFFVFFVFFFVFHIKIKKKIEKIEKYKNSVCYVYIGTCVSRMAIGTKFSNTTKQLSFVVLVCDE